MRVMRKLIIAACGLALVAGLLIPAHGIYPDKPSGYEPVVPMGALTKIDNSAGIYESWVMPQPMCVQEVGLAYYHVGTASTKYKAGATNLKIVAPTTGCAGYPRRRTILVTTFVDHAVAACAKTGSANYEWLYIYGRWSWVPTAMTIYLNVAAEAKSRCFATSTMVAHVASHELGHAVGLHHNADASVMGSWSYYWPTTLDQSRVNAYYAP